MDNIDSGFDDKDQKALKLVNGESNESSSEHGEEPDEAIEPDYDRDYVYSLKEFDLTEFNILLNNLMIYLFMSMFHLN